MTRRLVLVNMSNQDSEDYVVKHYEPGRSDDKILYPGEQMDVEFSPEQKYPAYAYPVSTQLLIREAVNPEPAKQEHTSRTLFVLENYPDEVDLDDHDQKTFSQLEVDILATQHRRATLKKHGASHKRYTRDEVQSILDAISANPKHREG